MASAEPTHEKASALDVKRAMLRFKRKHKHEEEINYLNITPMLDMMTIILVFLLKSLASSPANIPQSNDLRIPHSTSVDTPSGALQVIISRVSVSVNGRALNPPVALRNGFVDPSQKRGGSSSLVINPLYIEALDQARNAHALAQSTHTPFEGDLAIIADSDIPCRTIYEVLYTCAQGGFQNFRLLVLKGGH